MRRFVISISFGFVICGLLAAVAFRGPGSSETETMVDAGGVVFAPSASGAPAVTFVDAPIAPAAPGPVPSPVSVPFDPAVIEAVGLDGLVADAGVVHSCSTDQPEMDTPSAASSTRADSQGASAMAVRNPGTAVTDADGDDLISRGGSMVKMPGEVHDITSGAIAGEDLAVVEGKDRSRLVRVLANGELAELPLPPGVIAPREVEALPDGGALVTMLQSATGEFVNQVDIWYLSRAGELTRLSDLSPMVDDDRWAVIKELRRTSRGRMMATVFSAKGSGSSEDFRSYRFVFDPATGQSAVDAVGDGELVFDETDDGIALVGSSRVKSIEFIEMVDPAGARVEVEVAGKKMPGGRRCEVVPPSVWGPDPDAM